MTSTGKNFKAYIDNREIPNRAGACAQVLVELLRKGDNDAAEAHLDATMCEIRRTSCKAFYHSLMHSCARSGDAHAAVWCSVRMVKVGLQPNIVTFNSLLDACAKQGDVLLATSLWDLMSDIGLKPNGITYNTMINTCSQARDTQMTETWMVRMLSSGIMPCTVSFSTVIGAFARIGVIEKAEAWFAKMKEMGVSADKVIFNSMINMCAKFGKPLKAEHWLREMQDRSMVPDAKIYKIIIHSCAKFGVRERAEFWLERMIDAGCRPDKITFSSVIHACAKSGNALRAKYWMQVMVSMGLAPSPESYDIVLQAFAQAADVDGAESWLGTILSLGRTPNKIAYSSMIDVYAKAGSMDKTQKWLQEMVKARFDPDEGTFAALMHASDETDTNNAKRWAYSVIILAYSGIGDLEHVQQWHNTMSEEGLTLPPKVFDEVFHLCHTSSGDEVVLQQCNYLEESSLAEMLKRCNRLVQQPDRPSTMPVVSPDIPVLTHSPALSSSLDEFGSPDNPEVPVPNSYISMPKAGAIPSMLPCALPPTAAAEVFAATMPSRRYDPVASIPSAGLQDKPHENVGGVMSSRLQTLTPATSPHAAEFGTELAMFGDKDPAALALPLLAPMALPVKAPAHVQRKLMPKRAPDDSNSEMIMKILAMMSEMTTSTECSEILSGESSTASSR